MPPSVSSEKTTPNPKVSSAAFRSQTSTWSFGFRSLTSVDNRRLGDRGMPKQRLFNLGAGDVVTRGDDHVVRACLIAEVAVAVASVDVARDIPAVLHISRLAVTSQVPAACRAFHSQAS